LPYRKSVLDFIELARGSGQRIYLATAADESIAQAVATHLGVFDGVMGSHPGCNLKGERKLQAIKGFLVGGAEFDYIGDSRSDLPLFRASRRPIVVGSPNMTGVVFYHEFPRESRHLAAIIRLARPHQWLKNLLVFVPMLLAHQFRDASTWIAVFKAFIAMCLCASAVYVLNDLLDLSSDRVHHSKRNRPLAKGSVGIPTAVLAAVFAAIGAFVLVWSISERVVAALAMYFFLTTLYSFWLKRVLAVDVLLLGCLYTVRLIIGGIASGTPISPWLLSFSVFLFLSLALAKRHAELYHSEVTSMRSIPGRGYQYSDVRVVGEMGIASGFLAVLVFTLYINGSTTALTQYPSRELLWLIAPLLLYWLIRLWFIASRGQLDEDPVLFAAKDRISWLVVAIALVLGSLASLPLGLTSWIIMER
jgi:4-hydroxybenzoate polyprenyltransferase